MESHVRGACEGDAAARLGAGVAKRGRRGAIMQEPVIAHRRRTRESGDPNS